MKNEDIIERLQDTEAVIIQQGKRIELLEENKINVDQLNIPDYSILLKAIAERLDEQEKNNNTNNTGKLSAKIDALKDTIKERPLIAKQIRILLFPETDQGQYYKIVFGRLIPWGLGFMVISYLFILGGKALDAYGRDKANKQTAHNANAWQYLMQHANRKTKAAMDNAYRKSMVGK